MSTRSRTLSSAGLRSLRNSATRIYGAGSDPLLARTSPRRTFRLVPAFAPDARQEPGAPKLWQPEMLDRLQAPLTRYRE